MIRLDVRLVIVYQRLHCKPNSREKIINVFSATENIELQKA